MPMEAMNPNSGETLSDSDRPTGFLKPALYEIECALEAIGDHRPDDAEKIVADLPTSEDSQGAWRLYLLGLIAIERDRFPVAEEKLAEAATVAPIWAGMTEFGPTPDAMRLAAKALQKLGWLCRRQDRAKDAYDWHIKAYFARQEHGSAEECWETAISLGLDTDLLRQYEQAVRWYELALQHADQAADEPHRKNAIALANLASSYIEAEQFPEAVDAARSARDHWYKHDLSAVTATQADMKLGYTLLKLGEHQFDHDPQEAKRTLTEAVRWLTGARQSLEAFGSAQAADIAWNLEQTDFAHRILASIAEDQGHPQQD